MADMSEVAKVTAALVLNGQAKAALAAASRLQSRAAELVGSSPTGGMLALVVTAHVLVEIERSNALAAEAGRLLADPQPEAPRRAS